jgi:4-aminobutyrate aminotransferase
MSGKLIRGVKNALPYTVRSSRGHLVQTACGKELLDLTCGIGVTNLGHCHPKVTAATQHACANLVHAQQNIMKHEPMMELIDNLSNTKLAKSCNLDSWFLWNGGADAVEGAIKIARMATGKPNIITMNLGYHGRTFLTMGLTASGTVYRSGFGPLPSGIFPTSFPYVARSPLIGDSNIPKPTSFVNSPPWGCGDESIATLEVNRCLNDLKLMLRTQTSPNETACILIEPVLGEGGYVPPPPGFMEGIRKICDDNNLLLVCDEVQTGFGRTGTLFASEWLNVKPDILISAKGLANGFPLSAVGTREELSNKQIPGSMGGTYGGNAVACVAANTVFDIINDENENILDNSMNRSIEVRKYLETVASKYPGLIRDVRGRGLMIGIEFNNTYFDKGNGIIPEYGQFAGKLASKCWGKNLLILTCGPYDVLRLIPPLNISSIDLQQCLNVLNQAIDEAVAEF